MAEPLEHARSIRLGRHVVQTGRRGAGGRRGGDVLAQLVARVGHDDEGKPCRDEKRERVRAAGTPSCDREGKRRPMSACFCVDGSRRITLPRVPHRGRATRPYGCGPAPVSRHDESPRVSPANTARSPPPPHAAQTRSAASPCPPRQRADDGPAAPSGARGGERRPEKQGVSRESSSSAPSEQSSEYARARD